MQTTPIIRLTDEEKNALRKQVRHAELREKIMNLYHVRRWPIVDVCRELRIDITYAERTIKSIDKELTAKGEEVLRHEATLNTYATHRALLAKGWMLYDNASNDFMKLKALELISKMETQNIDNLQKTGAVKTPTVKHEVSLLNQYEKLKEEWKTDWKNSIKEVDAVIITEKDEATPTVTNDNI